MAFFKQIMIQIDTGQFRYFLHQTTSSRKSTSLQRRIPWNSMCRDQWRTRYLFEKVRWSNGLHGADFIDNCHIPLALRFLEGADKSAPSRCVASWNPRQAISMTSLSVVHSCFSWMIPMEYPSHITWDPSLVIESNCLEFSQIIFGRLLANPFHWPLCVRNLQVPFETKP